MSKIRWQRNAGKQPVQAGTKVYFRIRVVERSHVEERGVAVDAKGLRWSLGRDEQPGDIVEWAKA